MRTKQALAAALALGASSGGCSALFGGSRYMSGADDASIVATDTGETTQPDAFDPSAPDAAQPCVDSVECGSAGYCDQVLMRCVSCDADGDGVMHQACVERVDGLAWDCEPDIPAQVRTLRIPSFAHTLRAFLGTSELHVFYTPDSGTVRYARFGAGTPTDDMLPGAAAGSGVSEYDGQRIGDLVLLAAYDANGVLRYELEGDDVSLKGTRPFAGLEASGFGMMHPQGPIMLIRGDTTSAYVGFSAGWEGGMGGRVVMDVGGGGTMGSHVARFHDRGASPEASLFATGPNVALMPNDTTVSNPFLLWAGDVRDFDSNHGAQGFDLGSMEVGQLAVTRLQGAEHIVALGAISTGSAVRLAVGLTDCNPTDETECAFTTPMATETAPLLAVEGMDQQTIAAIGVSPRTTFIATTAARAFRVGSFDVCPPGGTCTPTVPSAPVGTMAINAPTMDDTRAVAVDMRGDPSRGTLTIGLARASSSEIQATRLELCFPAG